MLNRPLKRSNFLGQRGKLWSTLERCLASSVVRLSRTMEDKCEAEGQAFHVSPITFHASALTFAPLREIFCL